MENLTLEQRKSANTALNPKNQNQRMPYGMERERNGKEEFRLHRYIALPIGL